MHVLVATDGSGDADKIAKFAATLAGDDGSATVATIVRVPRRLVSDLRSQYGESPPPSVEADAEYVDPVPGGSPPAKNFPGDDAVVEQYLGNKRIELCGPIVDAMRKFGIEATDTAREGDDIATDIIDLIGEIEADVVVVGSHGHGSFQGLLGSTGAKLVRRSPVPVLVVRGN